MKKNAFQRGFTLIELMIVIVILGILMGTILPRLSGAQSRARDTAKIADLTNIAQALEVYYNDNGKYPDNSAGDPCLHPGNVSANGLSVYLKGGQVPAPGNQNTNTLGCKGFYYYKPLAKGGVNNAAYVLAADLETFQMANWNATSVKSTLFNSTAAGVYSAIAGAKGTGKNKFTSADAADSQQSIFVLIP
jgi:prepilin-type N-terminal cleavage/methylation domain-containing protein